MAQLSGYRVGMVALSALGLAVLAPFVGCGSSGDSLELGAAATSGGGGQNAGGGGQGGQGAAKCGDGVVEGVEKCDLGAKNGAGLGCSNTCEFDCVAGDPMLDLCDDKNACNGTETCGADHACHPGTPLMQAAMCGGGKFCISGNCVAASCGDGVVEAPEQCDDGNSMNGDGCNSDCTFTCTSQNPMSCAPMDSCAGQGTCADATHTCMAGTPLADGTACMGGFCKSGACVAAKCGDGVVDPGEDCDDGNAVNGDGCDTNCKLSCATPAVDCKVAAPVCEIWACNASHICTAGPDASQDGTTCGANLVCKAGACISPNATCGNGVTEAGEDCDFGAGNGAGTGCESNCKFSCTKAPDSCPDANTCNGVEACGSVTVNGHTGQKCAAGMNLANCVACSGGLCVSGNCNVSKCGDGCVDASAGETCEPPGTATCDAACHKIVVGACGNGTLEAGEQCDDGNLFDLDGCDSKCKYEMVTRMTTVTIQGTAAPAFCTPTTNRLGTQSLTNTALGQINTPLQTDITNGTTNIITQFLNLTDLTGVSQPSGLTIGVLTGAPDPAKGAWPAAGNPLDWWFLADHTTVSGGLPTGILTNGVLTGRQLTAGPSDVILSLLLGGSPALLHMRNAQIHATLNGNPAPNVPAPPPAQLAAGLTVFQTITADGAGQGLCGNVTADSLAQIPIPMALTTGATACSANCNGSKKYTYCGANMPVGPNCNSLLDALVGGCKVVAPLCIAAVNAQQPDVPAAGVVKVLTLGAGNKVPAAQSTGDNDAYSAYMKFDANRTHFTGQDCATTADCQVGKTCTANVCK